jgi:hypothetical protein
MADYSIGNDSFLVNIQGIIKDFKLAVLRAQNGQMVL